MPKSSPLRFKPEDRPVYAQRRVADEVRLELPLPPSANKLFFNVPGRGRAKTPKYRSWRSEAVLQIVRQRPGRIVGRAEVELRLPNCRGDLDNRIKPVLDAAKEAGVIADDGPKYIGRIVVETGALDGVAIVTFRATVKPARAA